jgi:uncharacterized membrane protein
MYGWGGMGVLWFFWAVFGLLLIILAVLAIIWLVRNLNDRRGSSHDIEQLLRREYASGRIDRDEFERRRADLGLGR